MMDKDVAIQVENLSKTYLLRHAVANADGAETHELLALDNVSFEIKKGESVGIFGSNGSGKSTLLKILAGVTKPTSGKIKIRGKVASILDIGAGFHPELSGRENVFLNGQIMGFSRKQVERKYEEIVAFSGVGKFIGEPVKNYSDGMYLRLAFSIMAHMEFDVYLFDEVLSVGDAEFMQKAKEKIQQLIDRKHTVLFVSHNLNELQNQQLYLHFEYGILKEVTRKKNVLEEYLESKIDLNKITIVTETIEIKDFSAFPTSEDMILEKVRFSQRGSQASDHFRTDRAFVFETEYEKLNDTDTLDVVFTISDYQNNMILSSAPFVSGGFSAEKRNGKYRHRCVIPSDLFNEQIYKISLYFLKNSRQMLLDLKENKEQTALEKLNTSEVALQLLDLIIFKAAFFNEDKQTDLSALNLKGRLLSGFDWSQPNNEAP